MKKYKVTIEMTMNMVYEVEAESLAEAAESAEAICMEGGGPDEEDVATGPDVAKIQYGNNDDDFISVDRCQRWVDTDKEFRPKTRTYRGDSITPLIVGGDRSHVLDQVEQLLNSEAAQAAAQTIPQP